MFTLAQLTAFRHLCKSGSYSRAAEALCVTQPAVSQSMAALQAHFEIKLIDVIKGRVRLTEAGRFLAERSEQILLSASALERDMREFSATKVGVVHLGATVTIGTHGLAPLLSIFNATHPTIDVRITIDNTDAIVGMVRSGEVGLALVEGPAAGEDLEIIPYQPDELVLIVPAMGHRLSRKRRISANDLVSERFIFRERGSGTRRLVEEALARAGIAPHIVLELPSGEAISRAVETNLGISIVSRMVVERDAAAGRIKMRRVADLDLHRTFRMIRSFAYTLAPATAAFASIVKQQSTFGASA
jgi:DNA-binding transcriptional LysR family regulator